VSEHSDSRPWMRLAGLGFELAASIMGAALLGWWIDRRLGSWPKAFLITTGIGLVGGLYNLIRSALSATHEAEEEAKESEASQH